MMIRVLRCGCGKMHCAAGIGPITRCGCGQGLWALLWNGVAR